MMSFCMFRETENSPIFDSMYNFDTGRILGVPENKFKQVLPDYFHKEFTRPVNFGLELASELYVMALQITNGLLVTNFYDIGVTIVTRDKIYIMLFEGFRILEKAVLSKDHNVFNYKAFPIGMCKTIVRQLSVVQVLSCLMVDEKGEFVTKTGVVKTGVTKPRTFEEVYSIKKVITAWNKGYDGILYDNDGNLKRYKRDINKVILSDKE